MFIPCCICLLLLNFINVVISEHRYKNANGEYHDGSEGWGYYDWQEPILNVYTTTPLPIKPERLIQTSTPAGSKNSEVSEYKPCEPYEEIKPNFTASNRRLSEVKCYDYVWGLKYRATKENRADDCFLETIRKKGGFAVLGGRVSHEGEFPHMAAIGWIATSGSIVFKCGGSLISERFVLTAGHCIRSIEDTSLVDLQPKVVRLGRNNIKEKIDSKVIDMNISEIIRHPRYGPPKKYYDIALMKLDADVVFTKRIYPACLWTNMNLRSAGSKGTVTGWGVEKLGDEMTSPKLKAAEVDLMDSLNCNTLLESYCNRHWCGVEDHQICAGTLAGGTDTCQGDSGGPIQVKMNLPGDIKENMYLILGITSFGFQCGLPNIPGIYTRVASFADWIEDIVWK